MEERKAVLKFVRVDICNKSSKQLKLASLLPMQQTLTGSPDADNEWTLAEKLWRKPPSKTLKPLCSTSFCLESTEWSGNTEK